jgi:hypothetical protein
VSDDRTAIVKYLREVATLYRDEQVQNVLLVCAEDIEAKDPDTLPPSRLQHACKHPSRAVIYALIADKLSTHSATELLGTVMKGLGGKANPSMVLEMIRDLQAEASHDAP